MNKSIIVTISKDGSTRVEANNFKGIGCAAVVEAFSSALGTTTSEGHKHELYEEDQCATITNTI
jgi:Protein of unknown function (DUF2997)